MTLSVKVYRVLSFIYAGLALVGSLFLLFNRKHLTTVENNHQFIHLFATLWLLFNCVLIYGLVLRDTTFVRIHLYFVRAVFGMVLLALILGIMTYLGMDFGIMDKDNIPVKRKLKSALELALLLCFTVVDVIYFAIEFVLKRFITAVKQGENVQVTIDIISSK
uniref:Putative membrane protein n=1 Tax=Culex tarsalis TaxID=7177 RepID=A0A1Q3FZH4_CULTA